MTEIQPTVSRARCQQFSTEYCDQNVCHRPVNGILRDRAIFPSQIRVNENNFVSQTGSTIRNAESCEQNYIDRFDSGSYDRCSVRVSSVSQPLRHHDVVTSSVHSMMDARAWPNSDSFYSSQPVNSSEVMRSDVCALRSEYDSAVVRQSPIPRFGRNPSPISGSRDNNYGVTGLSANFDDVQNVSTEVQFSDETPQKRRSRSRSRRKSGDRVRGSPSARKHLLRDVPHASTADNDSGIAVFQQRQHSSSLPQTNGMRNDRAEQ